VTLIAPPGGAQLNESPVTVTGVTEPGAAVQVNGILATVQDNGSFSLAVPLRPGYNEIVATSVDPAGNRAIAMVIVIYNDPVPGLEYQLGVAESRLDDLDAQLTAARIRVAEAEINLSVAQDRIDRLMRDSNTTQAELDAAQADLDAAEARVLTLEMDLAQSTRAVEAARAEVNATQAQIGAMRATLDSTQRALGVTQSQLQALQADYNSSKVQTPPPAEDSSGGAILGIVGVVTGLAGIAVGAMAMRKAGAASAADSLRQTPKRDFGDRMKAGLVEQDAPGGGASAPREPRT
jgi:hypothetical protein